ncbi:MAG: lysophospholipid acyltransferase family protein [Proteobacteria bacterium]|nr:lysophospholipid acyltransferase family protein [Pseudomonadota bacterium]
MKISINPLRFAPFIAGLFRVWLSTMRFSTTENMEAILELNKSGQSLVIALWHDELFSIAGYGCLNTTGLVGIVSPSKDGEFVAIVMERLGQATVRGSSSRGGVRALLQAKRLMDRENKMAVFAVDGPRGPRHEPKDGAIFLAQHAGALIVPIRAYPAKKKVFEKAWDKFQLPYPFTSCQLVFGEPYAVTDEKLDADVLAKERERMKAKLDALRPE